MSQDTNIDDGYEENPWDDEDGENLRIIEDFLPPPEIMAKFKTRIVADEKQFSADDLKVIEAIATERDITPTAVIASILHDYVAQTRTKPKE